MQAIKRAATALCLAAMAALPLAAGADEAPSPGWRTTGTQAGDFLVTPPGWTGPVPDGLVRIGAPTPYVWIIGRTKTDGPADYDAVHRIQAGSSAHRPVKSAAGDDITGGARQCATSFLG